MADTSYADQLEITWCLREKTIRAMIAALPIASGSRGLDVGCGVGQPVMQLAEAVGPEGLVMGMDAGADILTRAFGMATSGGAAERIYFTRADFRHLPFRSGSYDWAWSVDGVGYAPVDPLPLVAEMTRVIRPGGILALAAWTSQQLLPGYPGLEARLNATSAGIAPSRESMPPERHFLRCGYLLERTGLRDIEAKTFPGDIRAPLGKAAQAALISLFKMRWGTAETEVSKQDWSRFVRLSQPDSPEFILNLSDYYAFFTYTLFYGKIASRTRSYSGLNDHRCKTVGR